MDHEIKAKWIEALRSGKYKQGREKLRTDDDKFCCLGVLCDVLGTRWDYNGYAIFGDPHALPNLRASYERVPTEKAEEIGLRYEDQRTLWEMNDSGKRFTTIAKFIEKNL